VNVVRPALALLVALAGCAVREPLDGGCREITATVYRVERVVDGDTFVVRYDGDLTRVRLLAPVATSGPPPEPIEGFDAPEPDEPGGPEATEALRRLVGGRRVRLAFPLGRKRDPWGRLLATASLHSGCPVKKN